MNQRPSQPQHEQYGQGEQYDQQPRQQQGQYDQQPQEQFGQQGPEQRGQYDQQLSHRGQAAPTQQPHDSDPGQGTSQPGMQPQHQQAQRHRGQQPMEGQGVQSQEMQTQGTQSSVTHSFRDHLTDELRIALEDFNELTHVAAWCAKECASAGIGTCARICQDIAEIAELNEMLIARDSMFGPEVAETFLRVGRDALPELRRYQQRHPHIVETVSTLERTMNACSTLLEMGGRGDQQTGTHAGGQRSQWQESGGQHLPQQSSGRAQHPRF